MAEFTPLQKIILMLEGDITRPNLSAAEIRVLLTTEFQISEENLPSERTIQRWRKLPGWNDSIWNESYESSKIKLKEVLKTAFEKAIAGDDSWGRMVFQIFEKFPNKTKIDLVGDQWNKLFGDCTKDGEDDGNAENR